MTNFPILLCLLFNVNIGIYSFGLSKQTQTFYSRCIKNRYRHEWLSSIAKADAKLCLVFLQSQQSNSRKENVIEESDRRIETQSSNGYEQIIQYFRALSMWKNGEKDLGPSLLEHISPCWKHSKELENIWKEAYESRRRDAIAIMSTVISQSWDQEEGHILLSSTNKNHQGGTLTAADLILERCRPSDLGETFGRYHTAVYNMHGNVSARRIHDDFQSSCSSKTGNLMALNLNLIEILPWYEQNNNVLRLRVRIEPRRQYFSKSKRGHVTGDRVHIVSRAAGMVLHFTAPSSGSNAHLMKAALSVRNARAYLENTITPPAGLEEIKNTEGRIEANQMLNSVEAANYNDIPVTPEQTNSESSRHRRSTDRALRYVHQSQPPTHIQSSQQTNCRKTPYRFSRDVYVAMKIIAPKHGHHLFNIGDCSGECSFPLSDSVSPTSHAIAKSMDPSENSTVGVCCVPLTFRHVYYTAMDEYNVPINRKLDNFMAKTCGCR